MDEKPKAFILRQPIDYAGQRDNFIAYLTEHSKDAAKGVEIYDGIVQFLSEPGETFMKYDAIHSRIKTFSSEIGWLVRLYTEDDGNNALFRVQSVHDDFCLSFYTEFKSIYGDVEQMRLASIARRITATMKDFRSCDIKATKHELSKDVYEISIVCKLDGHDFGNDVKLALWNLAGEVKQRLDDVPETFEGAEVDYHDDKCDITVTLWENTTNEYSVKNIGDCMEVLRKCFEEKCDTVTVDDSGLK